MNEPLAQRLRDQFISRNIGSEEKKMFGGICFMVRDKMCVGITNKGEFMVRINPDEQESALKRKGARMMDFTHRPMKGFLFISEVGYTNDSDLEAWLDMALRYNEIIPIKAKKTKSIRPKNERESG